MKHILGLFAVLALATSAFAQSPDERYVQVYQLIQEADRQNGMGNARAAAAKYLEAQRALERFSSLYPGWNERVINYRLSYVASKLEPLTAALAAGAATNAPATNVATPSAATILFPPTTPGTTAPPAVASTPTPTPTPAMTTPPVVSTPPPTVTTPTTPTPPPATSPAMSAEYENQIKSLQAEVNRLQNDNRSLAAKLKEALSVQPAALDPRELARAEERIRALQKENELYKVRLAQRSTAPPPATPPSQDLSARIAEQNEAILALRAENEVLKKQTAEWRQKLVAVAVANNARTQTSMSPEMDAALRKANATNLELQKQLELWKQLARQDKKSGGAMPADAQRELASLRARVDVLEAKAVPYTAEELALFAKSPPVLATSVSERNTTPAASNVPPPAEGNFSKVSRGVPTGAGTLVRSAERAFAIGNYEEAEKKYAEVLRQDPDNITTLANLASAQLEQGRAADAEKHAVRALQLDPQDHFALYLLGRIRFQQDKLDEALDALSRSVKANPDYPDAQNYLGIVLSEKGMRGPAETALRRAIQLQPNNGVAHNNLAVVYATQKPPAMALARWHYKKAREAGHPANAQLEKLLQ
jgi:tetratricopeptide (TPR) repeat protein